MQFLNDLNGTYDQALRQILMKTTEPTLNQVHAMITQDKVQQLVSENVGIERVDPLALQAGRGQIPR